MEKHVKICTNREYKCSCEECDFKGDSKRYLAHIVEAHPVDLIEAFEEKQNKKLIKSGRIEGYYKQLGEEYPMTGTFEIKEGRLEGKTSDGYGDATWTTNILLDNSYIELEKYYPNGTLVYYRGNLNAEMTQIDGYWSFGTEPDDQFRLVLISI